MSEAAPSGTEVTAPKAAVLGTSLSLQDELLEKHSVKRQRHMYTRRQILLLPCGMHYKSFQSLLTHSSSELTAGSQFQDLSASKHKYFLVVPNSRAPRIDSRGKGRLCGRCSNIHSLTLTPQAFCKASRLCGQHTLSKRHLRL